jgi:hypothetical protein
MRRAAAHLPGNHEKIEHRCPLAVWKKMERTAMTRWRSAIPRNCSVFADMQNTFEFLKRRPSPKPD